ncbi:Glycyl and Arginyl tRNA synthetase [Gloeomargarita lithophora Alchichica-D10]|uniref:Glycine--tRNA ligase beta subunit n=1 Tax=Gloeomargarita lithophora Alchichica-D10 TaxID=1188229 RepID=A0A1J0ABB1_9CYAN|nr:glycine--tRNA ligase subunit beta [Gloeomargarita lithophora]APB33220.1 Glycyl and Arginyl tRNA synthetase [Gloeomargarita lithophora Alchichica-D10]
MTDFVWELGTEELPADFVTEALAQWQATIPSTLAAVDLVPQAIHYYGTPRRLAIELTEVPQQQPEQRLEVKGPTVAAAYQNGEPTPALLGFLRSRQAQLTDVERRQTPKGEFVYLLQTIPGRPAPEVLAQLIPQWWQGLTGRRFMRWGDGTVKFSRPIRWLLALWGEQVLSVTLENGSEHLHSDRISYGHRVLHPEPVVISHANKYLDCLRKAGVEPQVLVRQQRIQQELEQAIPPDSCVEIPPNLLAEVTQLVEWPSSILGTFDPAYLHLPAPVITTVMTQHQRYFSVLNVQGELLPNFVTISNGDPEHETTIKQGNERVLKARLADAQFFYQADLRQPLAEYVPQLASVTFQEKLGSVLAKVERLKKLLTKVLSDTNYGEYEIQSMLRTAHLCKADLVTQMVGEFSELQGMIGGHYALQTGESTAVAQAINEHYHDIPTTLVGQWVALAERLDTVAGILAVGLIPTGSSDPFALRRAVRNIILITAQIYPTYPLNLEQIFRETITILAEDIPQFNHAEIQRQWHLLLAQRLHTILQEKGLDYDLINALLDSEEPEIIQRICANIQDFFHRSEQLMQLRANGILQSIYATVNRASRLANQGELPSLELDIKKVIDTQILQQPIEQELYRAVTQLLTQAQETKNTGNYDYLIQNLQEITPILERFFDGSESVLVMDENLAIRQNRLNLLGLIRNSTLVLADFSQIVKI